MITPLQWLVQPLWEAPRDWKAPQAAERILQRHLTWRRSVLVLVIAVTALTAAIDTATKLVGKPHTSFNFVLRLDPEEGPAEQTWFGDVGDLLWSLSFYAMPAAALLALLLWARPQASRAILLAGWCASFLVPVAIALTPWSWWTVEPPPPTTHAARLARQYERIVGPGLEQLLRLRPQPGRAGADSRPAAGLRPQQRVPEMRCGPYAPCVLATARACAETARSPT
jgi:hypothetical protein